MVAIEIKSSYRLYKALEEVATEKQKHRLIRAIIAARDLYIIIKLLEDVAHDKFQMSAIWVRHASKIVLEKGSTEQRMRCMFVLPATSSFKTRREPMLEKILRSQKDIWFFNREGDSSLNWAFRNFWDQEFTPREVEMIYERVKKMQSREDAAHFLFLVSAYNISLTKRQRQAMEDLAKVPDELPTQSATG